MTTPRPDALTAESEALYKRLHWSYHAPSRGCVEPCGFREALTAIEAAAEDRAAEAWGETRIAALENAIAAARADAERGVAVRREALLDIAAGIENEGLRAKVRALAKEEGS